MNSTTKTASTQTLTEQYAAARSKSIVSQAIWTQRIVIATVGLIVVAAMVANYQHQHDFLVPHTSPLAAFIAPAALDLLTIMCAAIIALPVMSKSSKWWALGGLVFGVGASGALSALAPGDAIGKAVAAGVVGLIAVAEFVANHTHVDFRLLQAAETENNPAPAPTRKPKTIAQKAAIVAKASATRQANAAKAAAPVSPGEVPISELNAGMAA